MKASIGVNLRVTGHCQQGGRRYMEDYFTVAYQQTPDETDLEYAFFGIFDGHGGPNAAEFAKEHLMEYIVKDQRFWMDDDDDVLESIKDGFIDTHNAMWRIHDKWPRTPSGLQSTAGTTASIAFIRRGKIYIGHVGDSGITLGYQEPGCDDWKGKSLTKDHKPESPEELSRIKMSGGKVVSKSGVARVVWNRPRIGHIGPVRRSTPRDEIPFLAVARSLGDLWSYNSALDVFVVSPKPDVRVVPIDTSTFRCLIFATDGLYNMLNPHTAVRIVQEVERRNESDTLSGDRQNWVNPSRTLVEHALERWASTRMRADNTSVITLLLDPPGPPRVQVLRKQKSGLKIESRYAQQPQEEKVPSTAAGASGSANGEDDDDDDDVEMSSEEYCSTDLTVGAAHGGQKDDAMECGGSSGDNEYESDAMSAKGDDQIQINEISSSSDSSIGSTSGKTVGKAAVAEKEDAKSATTKQRKAVLQEKAQAAAKRIASCSAAARPLVENNACVLRNSTRQQSLLIRSGNQKSNGKVPEEAKKPAAVGKSRRLFTGKLKLNGDKKKKHLQSVLFGHQARNKDNCEASTSARRKSTICSLKTTKENINQSDVVVVKQKGTANSTNSAVNVKMDVGVGRSTRSSSRLCPPETVTVATASKPCGDSASKPCGNGGVKKKETATAKRSSNRQVVKQILKAKLRLRNGHSRVATRRPLKRSAKR